MEWYKKKVSHWIIMANVDPNLYKGIDLALAITSLLERIPTDKELLQYMHYKTIKKVQEYIYPGSMTYQEVLNKVLIDIQKVSDRRSKDTQRKSNTRSIQGQYTPNTSSIDAQYMLNTSPIDSQDILNNGLIDSDISSYNSYTEDVSVGDNESSSTPRLDYIREYKNKNKRREEHVDTKTVNVISDIPSDDPRSVFLIDIKNKYQNLKISDGEWLMLRDNYLEIDYFPRAERLDDWLGLGNTSKVGHYRTIVQYLIEDKVEKMRIPKKK